MEPNQTCDSFEFSWCTTGFPGELVHIQALNLLSMGLPPTLIIPKKEEIIMKFVN